MLLVARNESALRQIVEDLRADGAHVDYVAADVSQRESHARIAQAALERFGRIDTWINGAAVGTAGELLQVPIEDQRRVLDVNYWGVVYGSLEAVGHLRHQGGALINIGSVLGERAVPLQVPYCAAKHALRAFTDGLRVELGRKGLPISVTQIKPSSIDTPFPEHARNFLDQNMVVPPPIYAPEVVARAVLFACETPKRDIVVGFGGWVVPLLGAHFPRLTDKVMQAIGYWAQKTTKPANAARRDNLYSPRQDGAERSSYNLPLVRRSSLFMEAQLHPIATALVLGGLAAGLTVLTRARRSEQERLASGGRRPQSG